MKTPNSKEIYSKSTICDFLLMVSNIGRITYRLRDIIAYGWKSPFSPTLFRL